MTPDGTRVYVANQNTNDVSVIDTATNGVVATVAVGANPVDIAMTPDGTGADELTGNEGDDTIRGGAGDDRLDDRNGTDTCRAGAGIDVVVNCET